MRAFGLIILSLVAACASAFVTFVAPMTFAAMNCQPTNARGVYLAYCTTSKFTDYEHGAYFLQLEREAILNMTKADVLFLGSSLSQIAFSTDATRAYFENGKLTYHLAGFGYNEGGVFLSDVWSVVHPKPRLIVIHTSSFFNGGRSTAAKDALTEDAWLHFQIKKWGAFTAAIICRVALTSCGADFSIYRERATGAWISSQLHSRPGAFPVAHPPERYNASPSQLVEADRLLNILRVPRECVVITATPVSVADLSDLATSVARHTGASVVLPNVAGMATIDEWHLDKPSAEKWSAAFLNELQPALDRCNRVIAKGEKNDGKSSAY